MTVVTLPRRYPAGRWRGPVPNERPGGLVLPLMGLAVHVEQGTEAGTDSWFHNPHAQVSAHFGLPKVGQLGHTVPVDQWVEIGDRAWAEAAGNQRWLSVEGEGHAGEPMDSGQLGELAQLYAWLNTNAPDWFPLRTSHSPTEHGLGTHAMGGKPWGNHPGCPGDKRTAQLPFVIAKVITMTHPHVAQTPHESPHPTTPAYPGHVLELGSHGTAVLQLQEHLRARGWAIGATGTYDAHTAAVMADFQAEKHLRVDGETGPVTWWAVWHLPVT